MGIISTLVTAGILTGAGYVAVQTKKKYDAKEHDASQNAEQRAQEFAKTSVEVLGDLAQDALKKAPDVIDKVTDKTAEAAGKYIPVVKEKILQAADTVAEKTRQYADSSTGNVSDADVENFEDIVDKEDKQ